MAERRIGLIPHAITMIRAGGQEECAVLVTDRRTIIAFEQPRVIGLKESIKRSFEAPEKDIARAKQRMDFGAIDIDVLASINENVSVPHASIERIQLKKGVGGYSFTIDYRDENGKKMTAYADLKPSSDLIRMRKREGRTKEQVRQDYAEKCQELFRRALPTVAYGKAEWLS